MSRIKMDRAKAINPEVLHEIECSLCVRLIQTIGEWMCANSTESFLVNTRALHEWHLANVISVRDEPGGEIIIAGPADSKAGS